MAKKKKPAKKTRCKHTKKVNGRVVPSKGYRWPGGGKCPVKSKKKK